MRAACSLYLIVVLLSGNADSQSTTAAAHPPAQAGPSGPRVLPAAAALRIETGADQLDQYLPLLQGQSVAIFANPTSVIGNTHLVDTLIKRGVHIRKIFSPEHGFRGDADAGAKVGNQTTPARGFPSSPSTVQRPNPLPTTSPM